MIQARPWKEQSISECLIKQQIPIAASFLHLYISLQMNVNCYLSLTRTGRSKINLDCCFKNVVPNIFYYFSEKREKEFCSVWRSLYFYWPVIKFEKKIPNPFKMALPILIFSIIYQHFQTQHGKAINMALGHGSWMKPSARINKLWQLPKNFHSFYLNIPLQAEIQCDPCWK